MNRYRRVGAAVVCLLATACSDGAQEQTEESHRKDAPIINGRAMDPSIEPLAGVVEFVDTNVLPGQPAREHGSGVLVRSDWVITARHVFWDDQRQLVSRDALATWLVTAPGLDDIPPTGVATQAAGIDRVLFHRLGNRMDVALVHLDSPIGVIGATFGTHQLPFYESAYRDLIGKRVTCYGYGQTSTTDVNSTGNLMFGESVVGSVNIPLPVSSPRPLDGALHVWTQLNRAGLAIPYYGDSGGPCFYGPNYVGLFSVLSTDATKGWIVQSNTFRSWFDQILFDISASEFNNATSEFTAGSDMLVRDPATGVTYALEMGVRNEGISATVPVVLEFPTAPVPPLYPPTFDQGGFTWQAAARGIGQFNGDGMSDIVMTFDTTASGQPLRIVGALVSDGPNTRSLIEVFRIFPHDGWDIVSIMDADGDGLSDVVVRENQVPGHYVLIEIKEDVDSGIAKAVSAVHVPAFPERDANGDVIPGTLDPAWRLVGAADFDRADVGSDLHVRDRTAADLVWHNQTTGEVEVWTMGFQQATYVRVARLWVDVRDPSLFEVVAVGDYTRDGTPDIVWRDRRNDLIDVWAITFSEVGGGLIRTQWPVEFTNGTQAVIDSLVDFVGPR